MKTKENVTLYSCDHCGKNYQRKHFAIRHETGCFKNPKNYRACNDCDHCSKGQATAIVDGYNGQQNYNVSVFLCSKLNIGLVPVKQELKNYWYDLEDIENEPMKKTCEHLTQSFEL